MTMPRILRGLVLVCCLLTAAGAAAGTAATERAAWLLARAEGTSAWPGDTRDFQADVATPAATPGAAEGGGKGPSAGLTVLASAILPGSGEALMGYKRGYLMMAVDIFAWTRVIKYDNDGHDLSDQYYAFADLHYTDERLVRGYTSAGDPNDPRDGEGAIYFPEVGAINDVSELWKLPLYVTKEADRREYYENLGKWDQFIFGWDDYERASISHPEYGYEPTYTISDLRQPWVSRNREIYRDMRNAANDAYKKRDRWLYVNIGLRVFSVLQTAWLNGLLGGHDDQMAIMGHRVDVVATPQGRDSGTLAAAVSF